MAKDRRLARCRQHNRGFTLVELLAVVTIMGILATIGLSSFLGQMRQARTAEVRASISAIGAAQERFRAEKLQYFNVSGSLANLYPMTSPGLRLYNFYGQTSGANAPNWERLRPQISTPVRFGYATVAGLPGETLPTPNSALTGTIIWPVDVTSPWYVVQAVGDQDADGTLAVAIATSFSNTVLWQNENE